MPLKSGGWLLASLKADLLLPTHQKQLEYLLNMARKRLLILTRAEPPYKEVIMEMPLTREIQGEPQKFLLLSPGRSQDQEFIHREKETTQCWKEVLTTKYNSVLF